MSDAGSRAARTDQVAWTKLRKRSVKETYFHGKTDLLSWQKRPTNTAIPEVLELAELH